MSRPQVELQLPAWAEFATLSQVKNVISELRAGSFYNPTLLIERMLENPRLLGAVNTRINGLLSAEIRWEPIRNNRAARKAAREATEDFRLMAPAPQRRQFARAGLLGGFALAQRVPFDSPTSERSLFRLRPYWSGWAMWDWSRDVYRVARRDGDPVEVRSPSFDLGMRALTDSPWVVHEPNGEYSWREGLILGLYKSVFGHDLATGYLNTAAMKYGVGITTVEYPEPQNDDDKKFAKDFAKDFRAIGSNGFVPLPQREDGIGYKLKPFEFAGGNGNEVIDRALNIAAVAMAIVLLGHNLTSEVKGGSFAAAGVGEFIRSDIKTNDGMTEAATLVPQLMAPWAAANYGDPELAPKACYVTDPPAANKARADTLYQLSAAIREFRNSTSRADTDALLESFGVPLLDVAKVQVPAETPMPPGAPHEAADAEDAADATDSNEPADEAAEDA